MRSLYFPPAVTLCLASALQGCASNPSVPTPQLDEEGADLVQAVRSAAHPITGAAGDYAPLMQRIGDARIVLLGEASHGTHEFYAERARITRQLILEKGFDAVAIEGDWPDAYRVNLFVRGLGRDRNANEALRDFSSFPVWMWRNRVVLDFVQWLRQHDQTAPAGARVGFYGLDVYSLFPSMDAVTEYLDRVDPQAARAARERYGCFRAYDRDPQAYGQAVDRDAARSCQTQVAEQVEELHRSESRLVAAGDATARDEFYSALQNARLVRSSEEYFRSIYLPGVSGWNLRDRYMFDTLEGLLQHLSADGEPAKVVVWAHNTHVGNAAATHMGEMGEWNIGQLVRDHYRSDAVLVGFTTHTGTVTAASDWGAAPERKRVRPSLPESYEAVFHATGIPRFLLVFGNDPVAQQLREARLERAIGVIYLPQTERQSHYFHARLPDQFDAVIHIDETRAVEPLEWTAGVQASRVVPGASPLPAAGREAFR